MGSWEVLDQDSEVPAVHAALLPTGEIVYYSGNEGFPAEARVWDPASGTVYTPPNTPDTDLFCSGLTLAFDGRLLVVGGTEAYSTGPGVPWIGSKAAYLFEPIGGWQRLDDMSFGRWYPSAIGLPDGRILVASGEGEDGARTQQIEIYDLQGGWQVLPPSANRYLPLYPILQLLPDGRVASTGLGGATAVLDLAQAAWTETELSSGPGGTPVGYEEGGYRFTGGDASDKNNWVNIITGKTEAEEEAEAVFSRPPDLSGMDEMFRHAQPVGHGAHGSATRADDMCVLLDLTIGTRVIHAGGLVEGVATQQAELIDFGDPNPAWRTIAPVHHPRWFPNSALLPDGTLLVLGGGRIHNADPVMECEIFDPMTEIWTEDTPMTVPRLYHSVALLMPDGRVWVAGTDLETRMELYSPDYLSNGPRPVLGPAPGAVAYGQYFHISVDDAQDITRACLIRLGSVTHAFNTEQRCLPIEFTVAAPDELELRAPPHLSVAPPGHYMLFVMNRAGVPAVAPILQLLAV
jgi:Domain of unknown function (DUF1929)